MTLAEVRLILDNKEQELRDVFSKRNEVQINTYKKTDSVKELTHSEHEFSVDDLTAKADTLQKEIRILRLLLAKHNVNTLVDFTMDGEKVSLQEAIYLVKQYRENLPHLKYMGELKTTSRLVDPGSRFIQQAVDRSYEEVKEPTFDTKKYRETAKKIEVLITKLEIAINQANYNTTIDLEGVTVNTVSDI